MSLLSFEIRFLLYTKISNKHLSNRFHCFNFSNLGNATITWRCLPIATIDSEYISAVITFKYIKQYTWNGLLENRFTIRNCNKCTATGRFAQISLLVAGKMVILLTELYFFKMSWNFFQNVKTKPILSHFFDVDGKAIVEICNMADGPTIGLHYGWGCSLFFDIWSKFCCTFSAWAKFKKERQLNWTKCHKFPE